MTQPLKTVHTSVPTSVPTSARAEVLGGATPSGPAPHDPPPPSSRSSGNGGLWDPALVKPAIRESFAKLAPSVQLRNPVMFVVYAGSLLTTGLWLASFAQPALAGAEGPGFMLAIALWRLLYRDDLDHEVSPRKLWQQRHDAGISAGDTPRDA